MEFKKLLAAGLAVVGSAAVSADTIGFRVEASAWKQSYDGSVQSGLQSVDLENQLGFDDETNNMFTVYLEHPIPMLPNVALSRTELDTSASNMIGLADGFIFDGELYVNEQISTDFDLSHTDATMYYEILDNWVSLDLGLTVRQFDEGITIRSAGKQSKLDIDATLPMLYVAAKFELPLSGLYAFASANGISYKDSSIIDYRAAIGYETPIGLGLEAGLRSFDLDYEDEDDSTEQADFTIDGIYTSLFYHF